MVQPLKAAIARRWRSFREALSVQEEGGAYDTANWALPHDKPLEEGNRLWAHYKIYVDLYKHYVDIIWKASVWYYAITGAILTYYLANAAEQLPGPLPLLLAFLGVISLGLALLHLKAVSNLMSLKRFMDQIAIALHLPGRPHVEFAVDFVILNAAFMLLVAAGSGYLFFTEISELQLHLGGEG